jgi:hypothetical protein
VRVGEDQGREKVAPYVAAAHGVLRVGDGLAGAADVTEAVSGFGGKFGFVEVADPLRLVIAVAALQCLRGRVQRCPAGSLV